MFPLAEQRRSLCSTGFPLRETFASPGTSCWLGNGEENPRRLSCYQCVSPAGKQLILLAFPVPRKAQGKLKFPWAFQSIPRPRLRTDAFCVMKSPAAPMHRGGHRHNRSTLRFCTLEGAGTRIRRVSPRATRSLATNHHLAVVYRAAYSGLLPV